MRTLHSLGPVTLLWCGRHKDADMFRFYGLSIGPYFIGITTRVK